jgi:CHASE3 domain sensor protein
MNMTSKPYSPGQPASTRASAATDTMADVARGAVDAVKSTMGDALDRGQAAVSNASDVANDMAETANRQMKTVASELEAMARRNPLGTIAGAVVIGFLAGFVARGRT